MNDFDFVRQLAGVAVVFMLLGAGVFLLGRRRPGSFLPFIRSGRPRGHMEVVERLYLTPHHSLHMVRVGRKHFLISMHPAGCTVVDSGPINDFRVEMEGQS
jgi:hypothetical protein